MIQKTHYNNNSTSLSELEKHIKVELDLHLQKLFPLSAKDGKYVCATTSKPLIRLIHSTQRKEKLERSKELINNKANKFIQYFASGHEINPGKIAPLIEPIESKTKEADLFRFASLTWSVPVSEGYGRRMRFLVWDKDNNKLIGLIALGDPVFNLRARDELIGWTASDRKERLAYTMDAYVLGALPPYNMLLGGKLVACLVRTKEIRDYFFARYNHTQGIISGKQKKAKLIMITTTSSLGKSSVYNRLRLGNLSYLESIGYTSGYGHFHIPDNLFGDMREYLRLKGHPYFFNNRFGGGPNWKIRVIRETLESIGMDRDLLHHGIKRELFVCRLAKNADLILRGEQKRPNYNGLLSVSEVGELAKKRWICPRAYRRSEYMSWNREEIINLFNT